MSLLDEILTAIVDVDHLEAPPDAQAMQDRVRAEMLSMAGERAITGYSVNQVGYGQTVVVNLTDGGTVF